MRWWAGVLAVLGLVGLAAAGCADGQATGAGDVGDVAGANEGWTVLVYSMADNYLEPFLVEDIGEMGAVDATDGLDVVTLVDRADGHGDDPLLDIGGFTGAKVLRVGQGRADELADLGEVNTGDPAVLADFVTRGIEAFPAKHYAVIVSDHGAAWSGVGGDDSADGDGLDLAEIEQGLADGLAGAGLDKLDLLGFDACLMATYEVASRLAPLADRMLASQELEPGHGWDYGALQAIADDPGISVDEVGGAFVEAFEAQAEEEGTQAVITLSLVDLTRMEALDGALAELSAALAERAAAVGPVVGRNRAETLGFGRSPDPSQDTHMVDLGILVGEIGAEALDVAGPADALQRAIDEVVVRKVAGPATRGATGLSIYFPPIVDLFSEDYLEMEDVGGWNDFLGHYYRAAGTIAQVERPSFLGEAEVSFDDDGLTISATLDPAAAANVAEATISYGVVGEDGSITYLGDEPAEIADDGSGAALGLYDLTVLTVSDGEVASDAYLSLERFGHGTIGTIDVPMVYVAAGGLDVETSTDVLLTLTIDEETGGILGETYYSYDGAHGTYGELTADPAGTIVPEVLVLGADRQQVWEPVAEVGLRADLASLAYNFVRLDPGIELYVELSVADFGGNVAAVGAYATVP